MKYQFAVTTRFEKQYRKLSVSERNQVKNEVGLLAENPMHPSLRTKRIQGSNGLFECSVNMDIRIIWKYEDGLMILLLDVGHHDILAQY